MNIVKTITLTFAGILLIGMFLSIIRFLTRKLKTETDSGLQFKSAYGVWFTGLFAVAVLIITHVLEFIGESTDIILKISVNSPWIDITKIVSLYIGLSIAWYLLWFFIAKVLALIAMGKRNEREEMDLNNTYYFLIRIALFMGIVFSFGVILDMLLRQFMPSISIPFFH